MGPPDPVTGRAGEHTVEWIRPIASGASASTDGGIARIGGHTVACFVVHGAEPLGEDDALTICRVVDAAQAEGHPLVGTVAGSVIDASEGVAGLAAWGRVARSLAAASGVVPTLLLLDGPLVGGLALVAGLVDVVIATPYAIAYINGPIAVASFTGRAVDRSELGGQHALGRSGVVQLLADDRYHGLGLAAELLDHLPRNNSESPPRWLATDSPTRACDSAAAIVPFDRRIPYDVEALLREVLDDDDFLSINSTYGPAIVCGLGRIGGHPIGVVANQPAHLAGALDIDASLKAAQFVQWCDAFGLPLLTFVDTPGYRPGRDLETNGLIRHGGQLAFAYAEATVPRLAVITRKAYGGAYIVMDSKTIGNDLCVAWPGAEIAVMGAEGAVDILHRRRLGEMATESPGQAQAERDLLLAEYTRDHMNSEMALHRGLVDAVIEPQDTRRTLCAALPTLLDRRHQPAPRRHTLAPT